MIDMNIDWAYALLREATGIYLAHLYDGGDLDDLTDAFVAAGERAVHLHINAADAELEAMWPAMPDDLDGADMFPNYPIVGF